MGNSTIYQKTAKGQQAIQTRKIKLDLTMRCALIIVDGKTNVDDLHKKAPMYENLEEILNALVKQGLITADKDAVNESVFHHNKNKPDITDTVEVITIDHTPAPPGLTASTSTKMRLINLLQTGVAQHKSAKIRAAASKLIRDMENTSDNHEALSMAWQKCIKIIKLTIDVKLAKLLKNSGENLLAKDGN